MHQIRLATFFGRILLGTLWASLLLILSILLLARRGGEFTAMDPLLWFFIAGIASGNFVFMYVVADRLCRVRERWAVDLVEFFTFGVMGISLMIGLVQWILGDGI